MLQLICTAEKIKMDSYFLFPYRNLIQSDVTLVLFSINSTVRRFHDPSGQNLFSRLLQCLTKPHIPVPEYLFCQDP